MKTVLVIGAFDLLHAGHARFLAEARSYGDSLVVGVASDQSRARLKGEGHPMVSAHDRGALLKLLKPVDRVEIVEEDDATALIKKIEPSVLYTVADDWGKKGVRSKSEADLVKRFGGKVVKVAKDSPYLSSSEMINTVADLKIKQVIEYFIGTVEAKGYSGKRSEAEYVNPKVKEDVLAMPRPNIPTNLISLIYCGKVINAKDLNALGEQLRFAGKKVVFTALSGDLMHYGHAKFIEKGANMGNILIVGTPSNSSMRKQKGKGRPIIDEQSRAELFCYIKGVDYVVIFDEDTVLETLHRLKPNIFQTVDDSWNKEYKESPEYKYVRSYGGKVVLTTKQAEGISATQLINRAAKLRLKKMFNDCLS